MFVLGDSVRRTVYTVFTTVCGLGICLLFLLRKPRDPVRNEYNVIKFSFEIIIIICLACKIIVYCNGTVTSGKTMHNLCKRFC